MDGGTVTTRTRARDLIIKRPRLTKLLDESRSRLMLLVAPAGYGKTTLAREWTAGRAHLGWYAGGPAMADVAALCVGVVEVLAGLHSPPKEDVVEQLRQPRSLDDEITRPRLGRDRHRIHRLPGATRRPTPPASLSPSRGI